MLMTELYLSSPVAWHPYLPGFFFFVR